MTTQIKGTLKRARPWDGQAPWWLVLVEGAVALVLGAYILLRPQQATTVVGQLIALFLLISGILGVLTGLRHRGEGRVATIVLIRGLVGLIVGLLIFGLLFMQILTYNSGTTLLAIGMLLYGVLGLVVGFFDRGQGGIRWGVVFNSILFAVVGFVALFIQQANVMVDWVGPLLVIFGIALIVFAILRRVFARDGSTTAAA